MQGKTIPSSGRPKRSPLERVLARVVLGPNGCWIFTGAKNESGYGRVQIGRGIGTAPAHWVVYEALVGPVNNETLDHTCPVPNPSCVNPAHLDPCTRSENTKRQWRDGRACPNKKAAAQTHCKWGHEFTPENTRMYRGSRHCRACSARRVDEHRQRNAIEKASRESPA